MEKKYIVELTKKQLELLQQATEFSSRFICGQVTHSFWISQAQYKDFDKPEWREKANEVDKRMDEVKKIWWNMESPGHHGLGFHPESDMLWDMYQVIRHQLWKDDESLTKSNSVNSA